MGGRVRESDRVDQLLYAGMKMLEYDPIFNMIDVLIKIPPKIPP